ncbi:MAG: universal stress protein [Nitrososphaerota archaeon]
MSTWGRMNEIESKEKKHAQRLVDKVKNKAIENDITVKRMFFVGYISVVREYAEKNKMDLIVTGSRGMSGFKKCCWAVWQAEW